MHIWLHEASSSQYTGRVSLLSKDPIVESSRGWHLHPEALHTDVVFVALIELRSQLSQNKELFRLLSTAQHLHQALRPVHLLARQMPTTLGSSIIWTDAIEICHPGKSVGCQSVPLGQSPSSASLRARLTLHLLRTHAASLFALQWPTLQASMATRIVSDLHSVSIKYLEDFLDRTSPERLAHSYNSICVTATYAVVHCSQTHQVGALAFIHQLGKDHQARHSRLRSTCAKEESSPRIRMDQACPMQSTSSSF